MGGLNIEVTLIIDAECVFMPLSSKGLKKPTERALVGRICRMRQMNISWSEVSRTVHSGVTLAI
eukprot:8516777-Pyramimonas_sp.AAC.1